MDHGWQCETSTLRKSVIFFMAELIVLLELTQCRALNFLLRSIAIINLPDFG